MAQPTIKLYTDYKSPYAYLAKDLAYELERDTGVRLEWLPYTLDIPAYLGSAKVDAPRHRAGGDAQRAPVAARQVQLHGLPPRGQPARPHASAGRGRSSIHSLANIGMLYAKQHGVFRAYHDRVFELFWKRELDIESPDRPRRRCCSGMRCRHRGLRRPSSTSEGRRQLQDIQREAEAAGVFGVPSFLLEDGDLYWGREHLPRIRELLAAAR